jgi:hypothetical protein
VVEAQQVALRVLLAAVVVGAHLMMLPSRSRNHSVPRLRRFSPDFGSRQVIVHSITASSPSAIPCS